MSPPEDLYPAFLSFKGAKMKGYRNVLIGIFALLFIALCAFLMLIIACIPSTALTKVGAIVLPLCIIAGAVIALIWQIGNIAAFVKAHTSATGD